MEYIQEINLEINKDYYNKIEAKQGDSARYLLFNVLDNGVPFSLQNKTVRLRAIKPDETIVFNDLFVINASNGQCKLKLTTQLLAIVGEVKCELNIAEETDILSTMQFSITVKQSIQQGIESKDEIGALDKALAETFKYNQYFKETNGQLEQKYTTRLTNVESVTSTLEEDNTTNKANIDNNTAKISYKELESAYLAYFYRTLSQKKAVKIVCQGDSLTWGVDRKSENRRKRSDSTTVWDSTLDVNSPETSEDQSLKTYPEALQEVMNLIYGSNVVTVTNRGYSGDWVAKSLERWTVSAEANLTFIMLGTNDSDMGASWVPADVRGNIKRYTNDMRTLIERTLDWGSAVILICPPRPLGAENYTAGWTTSSYRNALKQLGREYNCPVVDAERFLTGANRTNYSDNVHLNSKGYPHLAKQLASVLIGYIHNMPKLRGGDVLSVRRTRDNMFIDCTGELKFTSASTGQDEKDSGAGIVQEMLSNDTLYYSFETKEDNLVLIPIFYNSSGSLKVQLDFGTEQNAYVDLLSVNLKASQRTKALSEITTETSSNNEQVWNGNINYTTTSRFICVANKGLHSLRVKNTSTTENNYVRFNGFICIGYRDFTQNYLIKQLEDRIATLEAK